MLIPPRPTYSEEEMLAAQKGYEARDALIAELAATLQSVRPIVSRARKVRIDAVLAKVPK